MLIKEVSHSPSVLLHLSILLLLPSPDICIVVACAKAQPVSLSLQLDSLGVLE